MGVCEMCCVYMCGYEQGLCVYVWVCVSAVCMGVCMSCLYLYGVYMYRCV